MGYVQPSERFDAAIEGLRAAIRDTTKATTTFGYGPRFLHSTGQFHKGGPKTGVFLQLVHDGPDDVDIPDAGFTFGTLKNAQADGDLLTLASTASRRSECGWRATRPRRSGATGVSSRAALVLIAGALIAGCGDDGGDGDGDEEAIREVVRLSLTTDDPEGDCNERLTEASSSARTAAGHAAGRSRRATRRTRLSRSSSPA